MPRCFSTSIQSEVAWRELLRAFTVPASWIAPPKSRSFSVSVVLPASGCEMIANVRRVATSRTRSAGYAVASMATGVFRMSGRNAGKQTPPAEAAGGGSTGAIIAGARDQSRRRAIHCANACMNFVMNSRVASLTSAPCSSKSLAAPPM